MKSVNFYSFLLFFIFSVKSYCQNISNKYSGEGYKLVWADEFNKGTSLDPNEWIIDDNKFDGTAESFKRAQNVKIKNGVLQLVVDKEKGLSNPFFNSKSTNKKYKSRYIEYSSALIHLKTQWKYGRFEFRAKFDVVPGLWPAVWTLGGNYKTVGWPKCGEIDIMEVLKNKSLTNFHYLSRSNRKMLSAKSHNVQQSKIASWAKNFHTWVMDWDENSIRISVDGQLVNEIKLEGLTDSNGYNPFRQAHSFLIGMPANSASAGKLDPEQIFPKKFEIDYFRIYQKENKGI